MPYLLGIDNGLTVSKAVIFDHQGRTVSIARRRIPQLMPQPRFVERDMNQLWLATAQAIKQAIENAAIAPADICAVGATAHGDGLYLVDANNRPIGNGILSLDSRASSVVADWSKDGTDLRVLSKTGQLPHASAPSALLVWMQQNQPDQFAQIGTVIACKDWLRFCLTGTVGTDLTEASISFTDVKTQTYSDDILQLFGLEALATARPAIARPDEVVGTITDQAASMTGLLPGTPVVAGLHDVTASALGSGGYDVGTVAVVAGTYSINETVSTKPKTAPGWFCRNGIALGEWNNMAISPASAANYDWFLDTFCKDEKTASGEGLHNLLAEELVEAIKTPSGVLFHPYLFGSPHGPMASASFLGLHGWHGRGVVLRALMEGIAFNHRLHCEALKEGFGIAQARLTGGISRNGIYAQLFADALDMPVSVADTEEPAAWGAALCAGSGVGLFETPRHDPRSSSTRLKIYEPDGERSRDLNALYALHCEASEVLKPLWSRIDAVSNALVSKQGGPS